MKNKKLILVGASVFMAASIIGVGSFSKTSSLRVFAGECDHVGNHYLANDPDCTNAGNVEFWACCKCLQQFTSNPGGSWTDQGAYAGAALSTEHVAYVAPNSVHTFGESGKCVRCDHTLKEELSLLDGAGDNFITPSLLGMGSSVNLGELGGNHIFKTYNFASHETFDFAFNFTHGEDAAEKYFYMYLGNQANEDGVIFRFDTGVAGYRYCQGWYRSAMANTDGVDAAWHLNTWMLMKSTKNPLQEEGHLIRIKMENIDPVNEKWHFTVYSSSDQGATWTLPWNKTEGGDLFSGFDYTFGEGYFATSHNMIRFSNNGSSAVMTDPVLAKTSVTYKNAAGTTFGHLLLEKGAAIPAPKMEKEGAKFSGWYDQKGRVYTGTQVAGAETLVLVPRFVDVATNGFTVTDTQGETFKGYELGAGKLVEGEKAALSPYVANRTKLDFYFYTKLTLVNADAFVMFGFPYDFIDGATRGQLRFDTTILNNRSTLQGYLYGTGAGLGNAGPDNWFNTGLANVDGGGYLVHMCLNTVDAATGAYTLGFDVTFMGNGVTYSKTANATFNPALFSLSNQERIRVGFTGSINGGVATFENAW